VYWSSIRSDKYSIGSKDYVLTKIIDIVLHEQGSNGIKNFLFGKWKLFTSKLKRQRIYLCFLSFLNVSSSWIFNRIIQLCCCPYMLFLYNAHICFTLHLFLELRRIFVRGTIGISYITHTVWSEYSAEHSYSVEPTFVASLLVTISVRSIQISLKFNR
jgi:hypothetical protein